MYDLNVYDLDPAKPYYILTCYDRDEAMITAGELCTDLKKRGLQYKIYEDSSKNPGREFCKTVVKVEI